jgi:group I intron endonuclease
LPKSGIYAIFSKIDGKVYIGRSVNITDRVCHHFMHLKKNKHTNRRLQCAFNVYGRDNFYYKVLEICNDSSALDALECKYISDLKSCNDRFGYNLKIETGTSSLASEETKIILRKMKESVSTPVFGFTKDGLFFKKWQSISQCALDLSVNPCDVRRTVNQVQITCKGLVLNNKNEFRLRNNKRLDNYKNFFKKQEVLLNL